MHWNNASAATRTCLPTAPAIHLEHLLELTQQEQILQEAVRCCILAAIPVSFIRNCRKIVLIATRYGRCETSPSILSGKQFVVAQLALTALLYQSLLKLSMERTCLFLMNAIGNW